MSAIVRVKRRIDEEPLNTFILKRRRIENDIPENVLNTKNEISTILKFAGTVEKQDEALTTKINKLSKSEAIELASKSRRSNFTERKRKDARQLAQDKRFKIVNCYRTIDKEEKTSTNEEITILDIEVEDLNVNETNQTNQQLVNNDEFVYDVYLPENPDENVNFSENYVSFSVKPFDDLVYEDHPNDSDDSSQDSEDSNEENYYKNDYPDTENSDISENGMCYATAAMNLDDSDYKETLSSDNDDFYNSSNFPDNNESEESSDVDFSFNKQYMTKVKTTMNMNFSDNKDRSSSNYEDFSSHNSSD